MFSHQGLEPEIQKVLAKHLNSLRTGTSNWRNPLSEQQINQFSREFEALVRSNPRDYIPASFFQPQAYQPPYQPPMPPPVRVVAPAAEAPPAMVVPPEREDAIQRENEAFRQQLRSQSIDGRPMFTPEQIEENVRDRELQARETPQQRQERRQRIIQAREVKEVKEQKEAKEAAERAPVAALPLPINEPFLKYALDDYRKLLPSLRIYGPDIDRYVNEKEAEIRANPSAYAPEMARPVALPTPIVLRSPYDFGNPESEKAKLSGALVHLGINHTAEDVNNAYTNFNFPREWNDAMQIVSSMQRGSAVPERLRAPRTTEQAQAIIEGNRREEADRKARHEYFTALNNSHKPISLPPSAASATPMSQAEKNAAYHGAIGSFQDRFRANSRALQNASSAQVNQIHQAQAQRDQGIITPAQSNVLISKALGVNHYVPSVTHPSALDYAQEILPKPPEWNSLSPAEKQQENYNRQMQDYAQQQHRYEYQNQAQLINQNQQNQLAQGFNGSLSVPHPVMNELISMINSQPVRYVPYRQRQSLNDRVMSSFGQNMFSPEFIPEEE